MENKKNSELETRNELTDAELSDVIGGFEVGDTVYALVHGASRKGKIINVDRRENLRTDDQRGVALPTYVIRLTNGEIVVVPENGLRPYDLP